MTNILGISAFYHDSAACLVQDGEIISAAQEERFTRIKHDDSFPLHSISYCLEKSCLSPSKLDCIAFYDQPGLKFKRLLCTYFHYAPMGVKSFVRAMNIWLRRKLWVKQIIKKKLNYDGEIIFPEHHESHAASAFFPSPYQEAAFLTIDGVGEWATTSYGIGKDNKIEIIADIRFPHSIGLLYSAFTYYLGFKVNSGEYKVMGLAPYGEPKYKKLILDKLIHLKDDGSFRMNMKYFNYCTGFTMTNRKFNELFGGPPRKPESRLTQHQMNLASSVQSVAENVILKMAKHIKKETGEKYLCLAGGVALNCVANSHLLRQGLYDDIWVQPAAGDSGGAVGAALYAWYQHLGEKRVAGGKKDFMHGAYLGPKFDENEIRNYLEKNDIQFEKLEYKKIPRKAADLIARGDVVGWFQGSMEFGPRALGSRSIIGDARNPKMQSIMNLKVKYRESFRPFAPSVLAEKVSEYFELDRESPYMLLVADVKKERRKKIESHGSKVVGLGKLKVVRSDIPAVTHVDYSSRIQTVHKKSNPLYYQLISEFEKKYGCAVIINTSFNVRGEPIVCTPEDAYRCFMRTSMDYLIMGPYFLDNKMQKPLKMDPDWQNEYELD